MIIASLIITGYLEAIVLDKTITNTNMLQKIDGVQYNTRELQRNNFSNIQVKGNALWGEPVIKPAPRKIEVEENPNFPKENFEKKNVSILPTTFTEKETPGITNEPYFDKKLTGTGIQLTGAFNETQKKIADKYSLMFKTPIEIRVVPKEDDLTFIQENRAKGKPERGGQNIYYNDKNRVIEIRSDISPEYFEYAILHEIGHQVFHYDEKSSEEYARRMMNLNIK